MFEAEIKYSFGKEKLDDIEKALEEFSAIPVCHELYEDTYYDSKDGSFYSSGKELRVRRITNLDSNKKQTLLTFKKIPFDIGSRSKAEHEVEIIDIEAFEQILNGLGFARKISFSKKCTRYEYGIGDMMTKISLVRIDSIPRMFIEIEAMFSNESQARAALEALHALGSTLGLSEKEICNEYYTDMIIGQV